LPTYRDPAIGQIHFPRLVFEPADPAGVEAREQVYPPLRKAPGSYALQK
jgi:hypothetical protein